MPDNEELKLSKSDYDKLQKKLEIALQQNKVSQETIASLTTEINYKTTILRDLNHEQLVAQFFDDVLQLLKNTDAADILDDKEAFDITDDLLTRWGSIKALILLSNKGD